MITPIIAGKPLFVYPDSANLQNTPAERRLHPTATTPDGGTELWSSDGTTEGTDIVADIYPGLAPPDTGGNGNGNGNGQGNGNSNNNGTNSGSGNNNSNSQGLSAEGEDPEPIGQPFSSAPFDLTVAGGKLFFLATDADHGTELWVNDPATGETRIVADLQEGVAGSQIRDITAFGDGIFFRRDDNFGDFIATNVGEELWFSDGTAEGTNLISDIRPGSDGSKCFGDHLGSGMVDFYGSLIFRANNGGNGCELFISDGTPEGTRLLVDIYEDIEINPVFEGESSDPDELTVIGDSLYFRASDELGRATWRFQQDGSLSRAPVGNAERTAPIPADFTVVGDNLFFAGSDALTGLELHVLRLEPSVAADVLEILAKDIAYQDWEVGEIFSLDALGYDDYQLQFEVDAFFQDPVTGFDAVGLVSTVLDPILAIRGSVDFLTDWFDDFHPDGVGTAQFLGNFDQVETWLDDVGTTANPVSIVGHSLGGGITQLIAAQYTNNGGNLDQVVTFNAPGVNSDYAEMFRNDRVDNVTHYVTNGDPVSMAGDAFLAGSWVRSTFSDFNLIHNHLLPVTVPFIIAGDARDEIRDRPEDITFENFDDVSWLSNPLYFHNDLDYITILTAATAVTRVVPALQPFTHIPASLLFRSTAEAQRQTIGQIWQQIQPLVLTATGSHTCSEADTFEIGDVSINVLGLLDVEATGLIASCHAGPTSGTSSVWLQGEVKLPDFFNVTANFTEENRIQLAGNGIDLIGEVTAENIPIVPNFLEVKEAKIVVNTIENTLEAEAGLDIKPWGVQLDVALGFINSEWNSIGIGLSEIAIPVPFLPGGVLNRISGSVEHIAPSDSDPIAFGGEIGMTLGPQVTINLPSWAGGSFSAQLLGFDGGATFDNEHLEVTADLSIINDLAKINGTTQWNWNDGTLGATGGFDVLDGLIVSENSSFNANVGSGDELNISAAANATFTVPDVLPVIGGTEALSGDFFFQFTDDGNFANDSTGAYTAFDLPLIGETGLGFRLWFDGSFGLIGADEIEEVTGGGEGEALAVPAKRVLVAEGKEWTLFSAEWDSGPTSQIVLTTPGGLALTEADITAADNMAIVNDLSNANRRVVIVTQPDAGTWTVSVDAAADTGQVQLFAATNNVVPTGEITQLAGGQLHDPVTISYTATDPDSDATISFYYDTDASGFDGVLIESGVAESDGPGEVTWDTANVPEGDYFIYAIIDDTVNSPVFVYSSDTVSITARRIEGLVWNDLNANGDRDSDESTVTDVTVFIDANNNDFFDQDEQAAITDASGHYRFDDIGAGSHSLRVIAPSGFVQSAPADDAALQVDVGENQVVAGNELGIRVTPAAVKGVVWQDVNRDGFRDASEKLRRDIPVHLIDPVTLDTIAETVSSETGSYTFNGLVPGTYVIQVITSAIDGISVSDRPGSDAHDSNIDPATTEARIDIVPGQSRSSNDIGLFSTWNNFQNPYDVNQDNDITAIDALAVINFLGRQSSGQPSGEQESAPTKLRDVNGDGMVTAIDALQVINRIAVTVNAAAESPVFIIKAQPSRETEIPTDRLFAAMSADEFETNIQSQRHNPVVTRTTNATTKSDDPHLPARTALTELIDKDDLLAKIATSS